MVRVLVTGATGFVGAAVVRALRTDGHEVTGNVRDPQRAGGLVATGVALRRGDMLDPASYVPTSPTSTLWCTPHSSPCPGGSPRLAPASASMLTP